MKVPKDWGVKQLNNIFKVIDSLHQTPKFSKEGIPMIRVTDVNGKLLDLSKTFKVTQQIYNQYTKKYKPKRNDIIFSRVGSCGISSYVDTLTQFCLGQNLVIIESNNENNSFYIFNVLNSSFIKKQIIQNSDGSSHKTISLQTIKNLEIPLPPLPEQRKIAKILGCWDRAITACEQLIATSKQQKQALMQQLLTAKKRFGEFSGEWQDVRLGDFLIESKSRNKDNRVQNVLSITNHSGFVLPENQFSKRVASQNVSNYKVVKKGEFGYNPSRINVGSFSRLDEFKTGILSPMYVVFSILSKKIISDYFLHWMMSNEARQRILGSTQGSVRDSVGFDALCRFPFKLPTLAEQQKIAQVLTAADSEIDILQQKLAKLQQEKQALMQQLLTGKRRVKTDANHKGQTQLATCHL